MATVVVLLLLGTIVSFVVYKKRAGETLLSRRTRERMPSWLFGGGMSRPLTRQSISTTTSLPGPLQAPDNAGAGSYQSPDIGDAGSAPLASPLTSPLSAASLTASPLSSGSAPTRYNERLDRARKARSTTSLRTSDATGPPDVAVELPSLGGPLGDNTSAAAQQSEL